jgi:hypothetical protein
VEWHLEWDQKLGMFTTEANCDRAEGGSGNLAIDLSGRTGCIDKPVPTGYWVGIDQNGRTHRIEMPAQDAAQGANVSPDGKWQVLEEEGIWLRTNEGETVSHVSEAEWGQVIWRPDSRGFFLAAAGELSFVSVPDLSVRLVDGQVNYGIGFQWLTRDVP